MTCGAFSRTWVLEGQVRLVNGPDKIRGALGPATKFDSSNRGKRLDGYYVSKHLI
jgi:hypothetical protein